MNRDEAILLIKKIADDQCQRWLPEEGTSELMFQLYSERFLQHQKTLLEGYFKKGDAC